VIIFVYLLSIIEALCFQLLQHFLVPFFTVLQAAENVVSNCLVSVAHLVVFFEKIALHLDSDRFCIR
jgi:hypothetical protein